MKHLLLIAALLFPTAAMAADKVSLESQLFVERTVTGADGKARVTREEPKLVTPGDKILFELTYKNVGDAAANSFVVTNPIPDSIEFVAAETADANVSVDGQAFAPIARLKVKAADGSLRAATAADVKVVRWQFAKPIPVGASGKLLFRGVVR